MFGVISPPRDLRPSIIIISLLHRTSQGKAIFKGEMSENSLTVCVCVRAPVCMRVCVCVCVCVCVYPCVFNEMSILPLPKIQCIFESRKGVANGSKTG